MDTSDTAAAVAVTVQSGDRPPPPERMDVGVPDRPKLAPGVCLRGEMRGTGFADRQWLLERDGGFIQLTELLYRICEHADGQRTLHELAADVGRVIERSVGPGDVRYLIATRLIPLGLIADAVPAGEQSPPVRSPLELNARMKLIGAVTIERFARPLRHLFAPAAIVVLLLLVIGAHVWLYLMHGVNSGLRQLLYHPALLVAVVALTLFSGAVHELGHAAALRYGGGRARGMGVGFYLVFPAFYTDTTESYRLRRAARIRTDLGGFYFHLLFASGVIAAAAISGQSFLLVVALLINLDILRQSIPLVRLDGYWALADLTGVPDLFSQAGPFLRRLLPNRRRAGSTLPPLKRWVAAAFALYLALVVPFLALGLFLVATRLPYAFELARESIHLQLDAFAAARSGGDIAEMASALLQIVLLWLPALGGVYLIFVVARFAIGSAQRNLRRPGRIDPRTQERSETI